MISIAICFNVTVSITFITEHYNILHIFIGKITKTCLIRLSLQLYYFNRNLFSFCGNH